jgi:hypothetical protein
VSDFFVFIARWGICVLAPGKQSFDAINDRRNPTDAQQRAHVDGTAKSPYIEQHIFTVQREGMRKRAREREREKESEVASKLGSKTLIPYHPSSSKTPEADAACSNALCLIFRRKPPSFFFVQGHHFVTRITLGAEEAREKRSMLCFHSLSLYTSICVGVLSIAQMKGAHVLRKIQSHVPELSNDVTW